MRANGKQSSASSRWGIVVLLALLIFPVFSFATEPCDLAQARTRFESFTSPDDSERCRVQIEEYGPREASPGTPVPEATLCQAAYRRARTAVRGYLEARARQCQQVEADASACRARANSANASFQCASQVSTRAAQLEAEARALLSEADRYAAAFEEKSRALVAWYEEKLRPAASTPSRPQAQQARLTSLLAEQAQAGKFMKSFRAAISQAMTESGSRQASLAANAQGNRNNAERGSDISGLDQATKAMPAAAAGMQAAAAAMDSNADKKAADLSGNGPAPSTSLGDGTSPTPGSTSKPSDGRVDVASKKIEDRNPASLGDTGKTPSSGLRDSGHFDRADLGIQSSIPARDSWGLPDTKQAGASGSGSVGSAGSSGGTGGSGFSEKSGETKADLAAVALNGIDLSPLPAPAGSPALGGAGGNMGGVTTKGIDPKSKMQLLSDSLDLMEGASWDLNLGNSLKAAALARVEGDDLFTRVRACHSRALENGWIFDSHNQREAFERMKKEGKR